MRYQTKEDMRVIKASGAIPNIYRFLMTSLEPAFALGGVLLLLIKPEQYLSSLTRGAGIADYSPSQQWIYTQLAGGWLVIVFAEAAILRLVDDLRIWQLVCIAILLSDAFYIHSCAQAVGGWSEWVLVGHWTLEDWTAVLTTWPFVMTRLAIVSGLATREIQRRSD